MKQFYKGLTCLYFDEFYAVFNTGLKLCRLRDSFFVLFPVGDDHVHISFQPRYYSCSFILDELFNVTKELPIYEHYDLRISLKRPRKQDPLSYQRFFTEHRSFHVEVPDVGSLEIIPLSYEDSVLLDFVLLHGNDLPFLSFDFFNSDLHEGGDES